MDTATAVNNENTMMNTNQTDATPNSTSKEVNPVFNLTQKPKKPPTAYFLFLAKHREQVREELEAKREDKTVGISAGVVSKQLGEMWTQLDTLEKEKYLKLNKEQVDLYKKQMAYIKENNIVFENDEEEAVHSGEFDVNSPELILPKSRVRKIIKADPEVKLVKDETLKMMTKATELFICALAEETFKTTSVNNRKTITYKDLVTTINHGAAKLDFLVDDFPMSSIVNKSRVASNQPSKKKQELAAENEPIKKYFSAVTPADAAAKAAAPTSSSSSTPQPSST